MNEIKHLKSEIKVLESLSNDFSDDDGINIAGSEWKSIRNDLRSHEVIDIVGGMVWDCRTRNRDMYLESCKKELAILKSKRAKSYFYYISATIAAIASIISIIGLLLKML
jgi:hypothetical protein